MQSRKYLRWKDLIVRYGISRATGHRWLHANRLPQPVYISRTPLWLETELDAFDTERSPC